MFSYTFRAFQHFNLVKILDFKIHLSKFNYFLISNYCGKHIQSISALLDLHSSYLTPGLTLFSEKTKLNEIMWGLC